MSDIPIHDVSAIARGRIARVAQINARTGAGAGQHGDHWGLNRQTWARRQLGEFVSAAFGAPRPQTVTPTTPKAERWSWSEELEETRERITILHNHVPAVSVSTTTRRRIGTPFIVEEIEITTAPLTGFNDNVSINVSGHGIISVDSTDWSLALSGSSPYVQRIRPMTLIRAPGSEVVITTLSNHGQSDMTVVLIARLLRKLRK